MKKNDFDSLSAGLNDALSHAKGNSPSGNRERRVTVDRTFVAAARLNAGLTQEEFARVTGASLGTVRKWERGERSPSGAAQMLVRILAREPRLVIEEAGVIATKPNRHRPKKAAYSVAPGRTTSAIFR